MAFSQNFAVPPLFVIEFLHRIVDVFMEYFGECTEMKIKENYVTVYEVYRLVACRWYFISIYFFA